MGTSINYVLRGRGGGQFSYKSHCVLHAKKGGGPARKIAYKQIKLKARMTIEAFTVLANSRNSTFQVRQHEYKF